MNFYFHYFLYPEGANWFIIYHEQLILTHWESSQSLDFYSKHKKAQNLEDKSDKYEEVSLLSQNVLEYVSNIVFCAK